ncbi:hypothetical protein GQ57_35190 [Burkholderia sp. MSh2]|nr:hypothetical protein GQ57_35190 [Burkholderia sp. MSh2]
MGRAFRPRPRGLRPIRHALPVRRPPFGRPPAPFHCFDRVHAVLRAMSRAWLMATRMTIVIYMGIRRLDAIATALRDGGLPGDTPCAAIENATRPEQRHVLATLGTLVERVGAAGIGSPAIVVIGRVAALAGDPAVRIALGGGA